MKHYNFRKTIITPALISKLPPEFTRIRLAEILGIRPSAITNWQHRTGFPIKSTENGGEVVDKYEFIAWARKHKRLK